MSNEWNMILEIMEAHGEGSITLHDNHLEFLGELHANLDPYANAEDELPDWKIKKLNWLYQWHIENDFVKEEDFEL